MHNYLSWVNHKLYEDNLNNHINILEIWIIQCTLEKWYCLAHFILGQWASFDKAFKISCAKDHRCCSVTSFIITWCLNITPTRNQNPNIHQKEIPNKCYSSLTKLTCYCFLSPFQKLRIYFLEDNRYIANKKGGCNSRAHKTTTNNSNFSYFPRFELNISNTWYLKKSTVRVGQRTRLQITKGGKTKVYTSNDVLAAS